jgi:Fur family ferric uptake transcriptional regulator
LNQFVGSESVATCPFAKFVFRRNSRRYEHDYGYPQHDHLICSKCGKLIEFENAPLSRILDDVATEHGFRMVGHRLEVDGLCAECSRPPRVRHRKLDMI